MSNIIPEHSRYGFTFSKLSKSYFKLEEERPHPHPCAGYSWLAELDVTDLCTGVPPLRRFARTEMLHREAVDLAQARALEKQPLSVTRATVAAVVAWLQYLQERGVAAAQPWLAGLLEDDWQQRLQAPSDRELTGREPTGKLLEREGKTFFDRVPTLAQLEALDFFDPADAMPTIRALQERLHNDPPPWSDIKLGIAELDDLTERLQAMKPGERFLLLYHPY